MLVVNKEHRETLEGVLNHPWIKMTPEEIERRLNEGSGEVKEPNLKRRKSIASASSDFM